MNALPVPARWYIQLVMLCGMLVSLYVVLGHRATDTWNVLMLAILVCQMAFVKIRLRFGRETCSMSMAFPLTFAALLMLGWHEGIFVAVASAGSQCLLNTEERPPLYRVLFSVAALVLTVALSGSACILCRGHLPMPVTNLSVTAALAGVVTYWLANTGFVSGAISLSSGNPFFKVWIMNLKWTAPNFLLGGLLAIWLLPIFHAVGIGIFVVLCPLLYLMYYIYTVIQKAGSSQNVPG